MPPDVGRGDRLGGCGAAVIGGWPVVAGDAVARHSVTSAGGWLRRTVQVVTEHADSRRLEPVLTVKAGGGRPSYDFRT